MLGLDKAADKDQIDATGPTGSSGRGAIVIKVPLEDINWAREMLNEPDKRVRADAASLNADTVDGILRRARAPLWEQTGQRQQCLAAA